MLKKYFTSVAVAVLALTLSVPVHAGICGEQNVSDNDCDTNALSYSESCCSPGYRIEGVVYNDLNGQDNADSVGAVCRSVSKGNVEIASDWYNRGNHRNQKQPVYYVCDKTEVFAGILCKDLPNKDALDGCTAICQKPNGPKRIISNPDLESNPRDYVYHTVEISKGNRVAGIGYKEEKVHTDRADCASISYKYQPIVK